MKKYYVKGIAGILLFSLCGDPMMASSLSSEAFAIPRTSGEGMSLCQFREQAMSIRGLWLNPFYYFLPQANVRSRTFHGVPRLIGGGSATLVGEDVPPKMREKIEDVIRKNFSSRSIQNVDVRQLSRLDRKLARRVEQIQVCVLDALSNFDHVLIAHAVAGGVIFEEQNKVAKPIVPPHAVYFSPKQYERVKRLSPEAQVQFWAHEMGHLENLAAPEHVIRRRFPLGLVQREMVAEDLLGDYDTVVHEIKNVNTFMQATVAHLSDLPRRKDKKLPRVLSKQLVLMGEGVKAFYDELETIKSLSETLKKKRLVSFLGGFPDRTKVLKKRVSRIQRFGIFRTNDIDRLRVGINRLEGAFLALQGRDQKQDIELVDIVRDALALSGAGRSSGIELTFVYDMSLPKIWAAPEQLSEVVLNLVINSMYEIRSNVKKEIRVSIHRIDGNRVRLSVRDNGQGIPAEILPPNEPNIFTPYKTTKGNEGNGLGLARVNAIVRGHGGAIEVKTNVGEFAEFNIDLPTKNLLQGDVQRFGPSYGRKRVLLVEDDPSIRMIMKSMLEMFKVEVLETSRCDEAWQILQVNKIDLLITDNWLIDQMTGVELIQRFKQAQLPGEVWFMSGGETHVIDRVKEISNQIQIISKPFDMDRLEDLMQTRFQVMPEAAPLVETANEVWLEPLDPAEQRLVSIPPALATPRVLIVKTHADVFDFLSVILGDLSPAVAFEYANSESIALAQLQDYHQNGIPLALLVVDLDPEKIIDLSQKALELFPASQVLIHTDHEMKLEDISRVGTSQVSLLKNTYDLEALVDKVHALLSPATLPGTSTVNSPWLVGILAVAIKSASVAPAWVLQGALLAATVVFWVALRQIRSYRIAKESMEPHRHRPWTLRAA